MKRIFGYAVLFTLAASFAPVVSGASMGPSSASPAMAADQDPVFEDLPKAGKKCWIGEDFYFTYGFDKTPKMGTSILKVELFDKAGERVTDLSITGRSDMPSMKGAHDSGEVAFRQNRQGDYLLPVNIVMPGGWEVLLTFSKDETVIFRGRVTFDV
jgi:hypothetical protein